MAADVADVGAYDAIGQGHCIGFDDRAGVDRYESLEGRCMRER